jgi:hypothetical protein
VNLVAIEAKAGNTQVHGSKCTRLLSLSAKHDWRLLHSGGEGTFQGLDRSATSRLNLAFSSRSCFSHFELETGRPTCRRGADI